MSAVSELQNLHQQRLKQVFNEADVAKHDREIDITTKEITRVCD